MDDRYLFRGKRLDNGEWVAGCLAQYPSGRCRVFMTSSGGKRAVYNGLHDVNPATVGQCTGLRAAKSYRGGGEADRLIFEGDVISCGGFEYTIEFEDACFCIAQENCYAMGLHTIIGQGGMEIVGTIHDRTEGQG